MRILFLLVIFLLCFYSSQSQQISLQKLNNRSLLKDILNNPAEDLPSEYYEMMLQNLEHPLELNTVDYNKLSSLLILSEEQIVSFLSYRLNNKLLSVNELQVIPNFDLSTINRLLPFVYVQEEGISAKSISESILSTNHYLLLRYNQTLEQAKGYQPDTSNKNKYLGSPFHFYARYKMYTSKSISAGFTIDKDAGETKWNDFTSFHLSIQNKGHWKNITLGDYQLQFGQGLVSSAGFYLGKSSEPILSVKRNQVGVRPYTSSLEQGFFRGATATYQLGKIDITGFYSQKNKDANQKTNTIKSPSTQKTIKVKVDTVTSLLTDGYHRNNSEIEDKNVLKEITYGGDVTYRSEKNNFQLGFITLYSQLNIPYVKAVAPYNEHEFAGKNNLLTSLHYSYLWQNVHFFGEIARSTSGGIGTVNGVLLSLGKNTDMALLYRHYDKNFHSFYANSFVENSRSINEKGIYYGLKQVLNKNWTLSAYVDYFKFPWYRYQQKSKNTDGIGYMARFTYKPNKRFNAYFQYRQENKDENTKIQEAYFDKKGVAKTKDVTVLLNRARSIFNLYSDYDITPNINLQSRVSYNVIKFYGQKFTQGFGIAQDVNLDYKKWSFSGRVAFYNTDSYDNSVYFYEQDVLYAFSFPAYYKHGLRNYWLIHYKANKTFDCWLKISRSDLFDPNGVFGSGQDEIKLPYRHDLKLQARIQF